MWLGRDGVLIRGTLVLLQQYQNAPDQDTLARMRSAVPPEPRFRAVRPVHQPEVPVMFPVTIENELRNANPVSNGHTRPNPDPT